MMGLMLLDGCIQLADLAAMAVLVWITGLYTQSTPPALRLSFLPGFSPGNETVLPLVLLLLFFGVKNGSAFLVYRWQYRFVYAVATRLSAANLRLFFSDSYFPDYVTEDTAVATRRISQQPVEFAHYILAGVQQLVVQGVLTGLTLTALLLFNARLCGVLLLALLPPVVLVSRAMRLKTKQLRSGIAIASEKTIQHLREALTGYVEALTYGKRSFFTNRYVVQQERLNRSLSDLQGLQGLPQRLMEVFVVIGLLVIIIFGRTENGQTFLAIGAFITAAYKVMPGMIRMLSSLTNLRVYDPVIQAMPVYAPEPARQETIPVAISSIRLQEVSFHYGNAVGIRNCSALLCRGELTVIYAPSGSGKSTLLHLLLGFLKPGSGTIFVNEVPANCEQLRKHHDQVAYVKQQSFLLHDTLLRNIILDDGDPDESLLRQVMTLTGLDELTAGMTDGYHMLIGEQGKNISGGQVQRIMLARALYKNTPVLMLDEPFSELDESSELTLLDILQRLKGTGKMIILVSHNPNCLAIGDKVIRLDENQTTCNIDSDTGVSGQ